MVRIDVTFFCLCIPLIFGAPTDDSAKQQLASGLFRNDEGYWNMGNPASEDQFEVRTRGLDSLGGNILRSLGGLDAGEWGNNGKVPSWRIDSQPGYKRGGGLDSLGRGNILRRVSSNNYDDDIGQTFGGQKRNFDEIDRNGFGAFVKKNFDEIDRVGLGFNKRNFDEIDRTGFGSFV